MSHSYMPLQQKPQAGQRIICKMYQLGIVRERLAVHEPRSKNAPSPSRCSYMCRTEKTASYTPTYRDTRAPAYQQCTEHAEHAENHTTAQWPLTSTRLQSIRNCSSGLSNVHNCSYRTTGISYWWPITIQGPDIRYRRLQVTSISNYTGRNIHNSSCWNCYNPNCSRGANGDDAVGINCHLFE